MFFRVSSQSRAWIARDSHQVVSLENRHRGAHSTDEELWPPQSAESTWAAAGFQRRRQLSNYLLFSVDENQKIAVPTVNAESETALVSQPNL